MYVCIFSYKTVNYEYDNCPQLKKCLKDLPGLFANIVIDMSIHYRLAI